MFSYEHAIMYVEISLSMELQTLRWWVGWMQKNAKARENSKLVYKLIYGLRW